MEEIDARFFVSVAKKSKNVLVIIVMNTRIVKAITDIHVHLFFQPVIN